jgi:hypothetical protein
VAHGKLSLIHQPRADQRERERECKDRENAKRERERDNAQREKEKAKRERKKEKTEKKTKRELESGGQTQGEETDQHRLWL